MSEISLAKNSGTSSPKLSVARIRTLRTLLTELNLHFAGIALLALLSIYLLVHLFFVWRQIQENGPDALHEQELQMHTAEIAVTPLRGLEGKIATATAQADEFSTKRLPFAVSQILAEEGALAKHEGARLARSQYGYASVLTGSPHELTELSMDVSLSGDYRPLVRVINALERDKMFFVINSMTLNGQETGTVNLRVRLTTYMRPAMPGEVSKAIVVDGPPENEPIMPAMVSPARPVPMPAQRFQNPGQQSPQQAPRSIRPPLAPPTRRNPPSTGPGQRRLSAPLTNSEGTAR